jgi:hypothetical protein
MPGCFCVYLYWLDDFISLINYIKINIYLFFIFFVKTSAVNNYSHLVFGSNDFGQVKVVVCKVFVIINALNKFNLIKHLISLNIKLTGLDPFCIIGKLMPIY